MPLQISTILVCHEKMYQLLRAVNDAALPATPATDPWSQKAKKSMTIHISYL